MNVASLTDLELSRLLVNLAATLETVRAKILVSNKANRLALYARQSKAEYLLTSAVNESAARESFLEVHVAAVKKQFDISAYEKNFNETVTFAVVA